MLVIFGKSHGGPVDVEFAVNFRNGVIGASICCNAVLRARKGMEYALPKLKPAGSVILKSNKMVMEQQADSY